jgi:hypothetical protein
MAACRLALARQEGRPSTSLRCGSLPTHSAGTAANSTASSAQGTHGARPTRTTRPQVSAGASRGDGTREHSEARDWVRCAPP